MFGSIDVKKGEWWIIPALIVFTLFFAFLISRSTALRTIEHKITDQLFDIRGPIEIADTNIVIVSVSDQADDEIPYKYPWPTRYWAKLVENLNKAGAKVIGIDVLFTEPDRFDPHNDTLFAAAMQEYGNVVLSADYNVSIRARGEGSTSKSRSMTKPFSLLDNANPNPVGLVRMVKDEDDFIRRYPLRIEALGQTYNALGLEVLKIYNGWEDPEIDETTEYFQYGDYRIPKYSPNTMAINFFKGPNSFPTYSFDTVIDDSTVLLNSEDPDFQFNSFSDPDFGLLAEEVFKDKIVLVGATMPTLQDFHPTPFAETGTMPGVEIHANAIKTILTGRHIQHAEVWVNLLMLVLFSLIIVLTTKFTEGIWGFVIFFGMFVGTIAMVVYGFLNYSYVLELTGPALALTIGYLTTQSYDYLRELKEKRRIRGMFSSYVSPALVNKMIESEQEPQLGGDEVYITAFFSDIQSFSSFSEQLEAKKLVRLINEYLSEMTDILTDQGGTLDKYIGDAIVAFFGAPLPQEDHAYRACVTSQLMQQRLGDLREKWKEEGDEWPEIVQHMQNRIGINTGIMVTGNMGSTRRFNYTMMGDNVNLAARCESGAKSYGVYTMVTEDTKNEAEKHGDRCVFRYLDRIVVKGRTQPVNVYEIMGLNDTIDKDTLTCIELFEQGTDAYLEQDWEQAIDYFEQSSKLELFKPEDNPLINTNPSLVYLDRCKQMREDPPEEEWDGVYVMQSK